MGLVTFICKTSVFASKMGNYWEYTHIDRLLTKVSHFESKHRCLIEKNVTKAIFCPTGGDTFLRVVVNRTQCVYRD